MWEGGQKAETTTTEDINEDKCWQRNLLGYWKHRDRQLFLDLYPEIRIIIYQMLMGDSTSERLLDSYAEWTRLGISSPLLLVNKQVSTEFRSLARGNIPVLETRVLDFSFDHLANYIKHMSQAELSDFTYQNNEPPKRTFRIQMALSDSTRSSISMGFKLEGSISSWLSDILNNRDTLAKIHFQYQWVARPFDNWSPIYEPYLMDLLVHRMSDVSFPEWVHSQGTRGA